MSSTSSREALPPFKADPELARRAGRIGGLRSAESRRLKARVDPRVLGLLGKLATMTTSGWMDRLGLVGSSWAAWRVVGQVLDGLPLSPEELALYTQLTGRETVPAGEDLRELWCLAGRGGGKSTFGAVQAVKAACRAYPNVRGIPRILCLAFTKDQAGLIYEYVVEFFERDRELKKLMVQPTRRRSFDLAHGVRVETISSSWRSVRGYSVAAALCDELAYWWSDDANANPAQEVLRALRPGLGKVPGSLLLALTTRWTQEGIVWDTFQRHHRNDDSRHVLVLSGSTLEFNPSFDRARIEADEEEDPESAASEYGTAWRVAGGTLVRPEVLDRVIEQGCVAWPAEEPLGDSYYTAAVDLAGGTGEDSAALTIVHAELAEEEGDAPSVVVQDRLKEWTAPFDPAVVCEQITEVLKEFGLAEVVGDQFSAGFAAAEFQRHGIEYKVSPRKTADCVLDCLGILNTRRVKLLDVPRSRRQWLNLRRTYGSGGRPGIADTRRRDDLAVVTARAIVAHLGLGVKEAPERRIQFR